MANQFALYRQVVVDLITQGPCRRRHAGRSALRSPATTRAAEAERRAEFPHPHERKARRVVRQAWPRHAGRPRARSLCQPPAMLECRAAAAERYLKMRERQFEYSARLLPVV